MEKQIIGLVLERGKIFARETNSEFIEFMDCTHGFCKPGYDDELAEQVIINHHAEFPNQLD